MGGVLAKALILDFGGVVTKTLFETHGQTEAALDLAPGTLTWRGPFAPESDPLWRAMQAGEISERDYWTKRTREVGHLVGEQWDAMETLVKRARGAEPAAVVRPEADRAIRIAHAAGVRLALLSNELDLFYGAEFRARLPLLDLFETIVDATYTGILKPDPRAYAVVLDALGLPPADAVFVDDQIRNVDGAVSVGLRAVHFDVRHPHRSYAEALGHFGLTSND
jgi:putative hydrolase of the HAD superfamily